MNVLFVVKVALAVIGMAAMVLAVSYQSRVEGLESELEERKERERWGSFPGKDELEIRLMAARSVRTACAVVAAVVLPIFFLLILFWN